jgi:hypothetical protein
MPRKKADAPPAEAADNKIAAYKGFNKDLRCRGYQFEVGQTYTHDGAVKACQSGFHACTDPWDVLHYYNFAGSNRFARVTLSGDTAREPNGDSKIAAGVIAINDELSFGEFVAELVAHTVTQTGGKDDNPSGNDAQIGSSGYDAQIGSSGNYARIGSSGYGARIGSSGDGARSGSSGNDAQIGSSGNDAQIGSSGNGARIGSSGNDARIGSSGYGARIGSSGNGAQIGSSGDGARIEIDGSNAVTAVAGRDTWVRASKPAWVSIASYDREGKCHGFATGQLGADGLKLGTWYRAENCKLVEVA